MPEESNTTKPESNEGELRKARRQGYRAACTDHYTQLSKLVINGEVTGAKAENIREIIREMDAPLIDLPEGQTPLKELKLSGRIYNLLMRECIISVELLATMSEAELLDLRLVGTGTIDAIKAGLATRGLELPL